MAEHEHDRMDEAQRAVRERNIVDDGGIARSDAEIDDVTRDGYDTSIGAREDDGRNTPDEERTGAQEVLGIGRDVTPDPAFAVGGSSGSERRRRADDLAEGGTGIDPSGSSYEGPDGLKVRG